jgi:hypothetical protein
MLAGLLVPRFQFGYLLMSMFDLEKSAAEPALQRRVEKNDVQMKDGKHDDSQMIGFQLRTFCGDNELKARQKWSACPVDW